MVLSGLNSIGVPVVDGDGLVDAIRIRPTLVRGYLFLTAEGRRRPVGEADAAVLEASSVGVMVGPPEADGWMAVTLYAQAGGFGVKIEGEGK